ncbi:MAG: ABC transporter permease [Bdellovibrionaceae bacterium]|nr:ABC transporter permease [Pseudobdellovibrionaceae bacterium]
MKLKEIFIPPRLHKGVLHVWLRNFLYYRKTWVASILWTCLEPLMYLGAIGYGLGSYVSNIDGGSYIEFFFPGILCFTAMFVSFIDGTYGNFAKFTYQKTYQTIMLSPVSPEEVVVGEILWTTSKGFFGACGVALVGSLLGLVDSWRIFPTLLFLFSVSWLFSSIAMIVTSIVRNYDSFIYWTSGFLTPMSLIAGVYFPIGQLPDGLRHAAWILPLTHALAAVRDILDGALTWRSALSVFLVLFFGWVLTNVAIHRIRRKLLR